jgi:hypothetical protein
MPNVLQTVTAWTALGPLPSSSGQILEQAAANEIIAANRQNARSQGLTLNSEGSITDPVSGITILQSYVTADPLYDTPAHGMCGNPPPAPSPKAIDAIGPGTFMLFSWGQSHVCNCGRGRYTSRNSATWVWSAGQSYPCSDPIVGPDGTDGSIWPRFADAVMGAPLNDTAINRVIIDCCARGGTSISDWDHGGDLNNHLVSELTAFLQQVGMPTFLHYCQGPADTGGMTTAQWFTKFQSMLGSVRATGCTSPIYIDIDTICNLRDAATPPPNTASHRTALDLINIEIGRQDIRAAQIQAQRINANTRAGANFDAIDWHLRAYGDGCHLGELGLAAHAQALVQAMFPSSTSRSA